MMFLRCRQFLVSEGDVLDEASGWLLCAADLYSFHAHRVNIMGVILDQQGCSTGKDHTGRHYSTHYDNAAVVLKVTI